MTAPEHAATAAELVARYGAGAMSDDTALTAMTTLTGLDEADAAGLLVDQWYARCRAAEQPTRHDDGSWTP